jgi:glycosyltransferase involved in cell wall biosynthesis
VNRTILVIPCFNEAARLPRPVFEAFVEAHPGVSFVLVDDGSADATGTLLAEMAARRPDRFRVCALGRNHGKAEAVRRGMLEALDQEPCFAGYWDADLATPLDALPEFVRVLERRPELAVVFGARVRLLGRAVVRPPGRYLLGRLFAAAAAQLLDLPIYDTQCGAKLFRCSPAVRALFETPFVSGWVFDVELLARMLAQQRSGDGLPVAERVYELPLRSWHDVSGTKLHPGDLPRLLLDLWRIRRRYLGSRPLRRAVRGSTSARSLR